MRNYFLKQVSILILLTFFLNLYSFSQWKPTSGLYSGAVHSVIYNNGEIIVGTNYIYKSADDGRIWNISNNGISGTVSAIRGLSLSGSNVIAATDAGVFYSSDNGNNWSQSAGTASLNCWSMIVKGNNIFISTLGSGIYRSNNDGVTWTAVNTGITTPLVDMRSLAVRGTDIYAGSDGYGIFKSTDDGAHWTTVNTGLPGSYYSVNALACVGTTIIAGTGGAGIYKSTNGTSWSAINNGVSSTDYIMGMSVNGTSVYASTFLGTLYKTTDYTNWNAVTVGPFMTTRYEAFYSDGSDFYVGTNGYGTSEKSFGLYKTSDDGTMWKHIGITEFPVSVIEVSGNNILAGTNDISGNSGRIALFKTTENDSVWAYNLGGFAGLNITALKANGAVVYLFSDDGPGQSLVYRSTNNGNNWTSTGFSSLYSNMVDFAIAGSIIYAADNSSYSSSHVLVSSDNGATWSAVNSGIPSSVNRVYSLTLKGTLLFAATNDGIYKNTVGTNNWSAVNSGLTNLIIKSIYLSGNTLYAGTQGSGIYKSTNDGGMWTEANLGIPLFTNVTCFASSGDKVFAGTDNGVFASADSGSSWGSINTGLVDTSITTLKASANYLWAGTYSHGVWRRQISEIPFPSGIANIDEQSWFNLYPNPSDDFIHINVPYFLNFDGGEVFIYDVTGRLVIQKSIDQPEFEIDLRDLCKGIYLITFENKTISKTIKFVKK